MVEAPHACLQCHTPIKLPTPSEMASMKHGEGYVVLCTDCKHLMLFDGMAVRMPQSEEQEATVKAMLAAGVGVTFAACQHLVAMPLFEDCVPPVPDCREHVRSETSDSGLTCPYCRTAFEILMPLHSEVDMKTRCLTVCGTCHHFLHLEGGRCAAVGFDDTRRLIGVLTQRRVLAVFGPCGHFVFVRVVAEDDDAFNVTPR